MAQNNNPTPRNMTFRQIVDTFETIADKHDLIKSFDSGSLQEVDIEKMDLELFPLLYITPNPVTIDTQTIIYSFDVIIADHTGGGEKGQRRQMKKSQQIFSNYRGLNDTYNQTLWIMRDVISNFRQNVQAKSWVDQRIDLELPTSLEPFTSRFANLLSGWAGTLNITCQNTNNLCDVPQTMNT
tara:strand:- start:19062 stop:19610 length:549 start_codon:yes stop_codon:yes gene_type:complete